MFYFKRIVAIALMALVVVPMIATRAEAGTKNTRSNETALRGSNFAGQRAPNFTLKDLNGREVNTQDLRGKVVLIDFWASWCPPCRLEMPTLEKLHREFKDKGLVVLGVNVEGRQDAEDFISENSYSFKTLVDEDGDASSKYQVRVIPTMLMIDRNGKIVAHHTGLQSEATLRADLMKVGIVDVDARRGGQPSVIHTGYRVDSLTADAATQSLTGKQFYQLRKSRPGTTKAEALRQAQLALLHGQVKSSATGNQGRGPVIKDSFKPDPQAPYSHPYFWAPFILIGNWK